MFEFLFNLWTERKTSWKASTARYISVNINIEKMLKGEIIW